MLSAFKKDNLSTFTKKKKNGERNILLRRRYKEGVGRGKYFGFPFCKAGWCESYDML